jgi:alkylation response protein AidB-like acyl-CoA dehydrogenase
VNPDLSPDQRLLVETSNRLIQATLPLDGVRKLAGSGAGLDPDHRRKAADLGWFAFLAPEEFGGGGVSGEGLCDAALFAEVRGAALQPGNFIDTNVTVAALTGQPTDERVATVLPELVSGATAAAWALAGPTGNWSGSEGVECRSAPDGYRLSGGKSHVIDAQSANWLLVTTVAAEGPTQFLIPANTPGLTIKVMSGLELSRSLCQVRFDDVAVPGSALIGRPGSAAADVDSQLQLACVLAVAETVGAMQYLFDLTVQYCKDRIAFGRPIGSFQAVKHQLADASLAVEMSQACATGAARAVQSGSSGAQAASMAKAFVGDAAVEVAHVCWQLFGGISYTWEHDFHLYLRRLTTDASLYGSPTWHRERLCERAGV